MAEPVLVVLAAAGGVVAALVASAPHGPRVTTDSIVYLSTSDNLRAGHGLVSFEGSSITQYPPGFPMLLAGLAALVGGSLEAARIVDAACLGAIVVLAWLLLRRHVGSAALRVGGAVGVALSPALFFVSSAAWSEPSFIVLELATLLALGAALTGEHGRRWAAVAGLLAGGAFCIRYSGLWLVLTAPLVLLIGRVGAAALRERALRAALSLAVGGVAVVVVVQRNLRLTDGYALGNRGPANTSAGRALRDTAAELGRWLVPSDASTPVRVVGLVALVALAALVGAAVTRGRRQARPPAVRRMAPAWPLAVFVAGYVVLLLVSTRGYLDPIGARLLSPLFVVLVVLALVGLDRVVARTGTRRVVVAALALVAAWLVAEAQTTVDELRVLHRDGAGYSEPQWRRSALVALVRRHGPRPTYSNRTDALYFRASMTASCWATRRPTTCIGAGPDLTLLGPRGSGYLAWFTEPDGPRPYLPPEVAGRVRLTVVRRVADGALYRVRRTGG